MSKRKWTREKAIEKLASLHKNNYPLRAKVIEEVDPQLYRAIYYKDKEGNQLIL